MLWVNLDKLEKKRRAAISGIYAEMDLGPFPCSLGRDKSCKPCKTLLKFHVNTLNLEQKSTFSLGLF